MNCLILLGLLLAAVVACKFLNNILYKVPVLGKLPISHRQNDHITCYLTLICKNNSYSFLNKYNLAPLYT